MITSKETQPPPEHKEEPKEAQETIDREALAIQHINPFETRPHIDDQGSRRMPTEKERRFMDSNLQSLQQLVGGSNVRWQIDGALNISALGGDYIGVHKDIDLGIERDDLGQLAGHLGTKGYGVFISRPEDTRDPNSPNVYERVTSPSQVAHSREHLTIAAIDNKGRVRTDALLNHMDLHIIERNKQGTAIGNGGAELPEKWMTPSKVTFTGVELNISHPAKVAYYKLFAGREYDLQDNRTLVQTDALTAGDIETIKKVIDQGVANYDKRPSELASSMVSALGAHPSRESIMSFLQDQPEIKDRLEEFAPHLTRIAENILQSDFTIEQVKKTILDTFQIPQKIEKAKRAMLTLEQDFEDLEKEKSIRKNLEQDIR